MRAALEHSRLLFDIFSIKLLVWLLGTEGALLDSDFFLYVCYADLADYHRARGRTFKADRLDAIAEAHYQAAPGDDHPPAAAMAMPLPRAPIRTDAVATVRVTPKVTRLTPRSTGA
jgi:hypothetical protein